MENTGENSVSPTLPARAHRMMPASSMTKDYVYNDTNEEIGSIKEIVVDIPDGRISYAVLSVGGFLGLGEHLFAIPWNVLTFDADRRYYRVHASKERLKNAPAFDKNHWSDMSDESWSKADEYWRAPLTAPDAPSPGGDHLA